MDLERLKAVQSARSSYVEAANADLPETQKGDVEQLKERFRIVAERMAKYVAHHHYKPLEDELHRRQISGARQVGIFEGPMPEVQVRFGYSYDLADTDRWANNGGTGFNEHDENIKGIWVEWIHAPAGVTAEPIRHSDSVPMLTEYGEVFATEYLSFSDIEILAEEGMDEGMERLQGFHPSIRLTLIEQSMDQYEAAPPSPYELREGLVAA